MIEIEIKAGRDPRALADLIAQTQGDAFPDQRSMIGVAATMVRTHQAEEARKRPSAAEVETVNFATIDEDIDFSEV
jgi:hypothetical protein